MTASADPRELALDLLRRARLEPLANVRANFVAAAGRWTVIAERQEQLARERAETGDKLRAERLTRASDLAL